MKIDKFKKKKRKQKCNAKWKYSYVKHICTSLIIFFKNMQSAREKWWKKKDFMTYKIEQPCEVVIISTADN